MQTNEIRSMFLDFFSKKDHLILPSFSLIPQNDPTLLLIGAGMAPLKPYFTGEKQPPHPRVATSQKCVRTPDIEEVGKTGRHATFFEMLGNFSFGDYFKEDAIAWAWELVTQGFGFSPERLWITIYLEDDEAFHIWRDQIGIPEEKIVRMGKEDNFWEIGVGPCGPCSEIYYDLGPKAGCNTPNCQVGCDCDRFLEIWNLVFTQFNRTPSGELENLAVKNIDTGAGLERLSMALQGVNSIYEIDTISPLVAHLAEKAASSGTTPDKDNISLRIVTEHLRGITFLVGDGVLPSNEGRGYVLRRLLRRALRHGRLLGIDQIFLYEAASRVISLMEEPYPELRQREEYITQIIKIEEERFQETLNQGCQLLEEELEKLNSQGKSFLPGAKAFQLYDTYGFPLDLTKEILAEHHMEVEEEEFNRHLEDQRERARKSAKNPGVFSHAAWDEISHLESEFVGDDRLETESVIKGMLKEGSQCTEAQEEDQVEIILHPTPFYPESGGQIGDTGYLSKEQGMARVMDTYYNQYEQIVQKVKILQGSFQLQEAVTSKVDQEKRQALRRSHTSTHLLHQALRDLLGEHVNQTGSLVEPDRLRFDFTHFSPLQEEEWEQLERKINEKIRHNLPVKINFSTLEEAKEKGALALFEGKYTEHVRLLEIGEYSLELCGGTHLNTTGEAGFFKLRREESVGAGVRRLEALTGEESRKLVCHQERQLKQVVSALKTTPEQLEEKLQEWLESYRALEDNQQKLQRELYSYRAEDLISRANVLSDFQLISAQTPAQNMDSLREMADIIKERTERVVVVLGAVNEGKVMLIAAATRDLVEEGINASELVKGISPLISGGGGGRPDMAQAGGKNPEGLPKALEEAENLVIKQQDKARSS